MFGRTQIVASCLLALGALGLGAGTVQGQTPHRSLAASSDAGVAGVPMSVPAIHIPRPGQDDGQGGDFQAPHRIRTVGPSGTGQQAGQSAGGGATGGAAAGGAAPGGAAGPVSGLLAPVVGALHL